MKAVREYNVLLSERINKIRTGATVVSEKPSSWFYQNCNYESDTDSVRRANSYWEVNQNKEMHRHGASGTKSIVCSRTRLLNCIQYTGPTNWQIEEPNVLLQLRDHECLKMPDLFGNRRKRKLASRVSRASRVKRGKPSHVTEPTELAEPCCRVSRASRVKRAELAEPCSRASHLKEPVLRL